LEVGIGLVLIISGIPVYLIFIYWKHKPLWLIRTSGKLSVIVAHLVQPAHYWSFSVFLPPLPFHPRSIQIFFEIMSFFSLSV
jgi:hypothetical protein